LDDLGATWHITRNYFRLYACCNPIHPALDSLRHALGELEAKPEEIDRIDIATYRFASVMRNPDPPNFFASKYSLPHVAAVLAVKGRAGHSDVGDEALADPSIVALRHRVNVTEDAQMSAVAPKLRPARVTVKLKDGREATHSCESHRGDFNRPFEDSELRDKFHELAAHVVSAETAKRTEEAIDRAEAWRSVRELPTLLKEDAACST
jgi:2-methylcitrate dehydratase PrpD